MADAAAFFGRPASPGKDSVKNNLTRKLRIGCFWQRSLPHRRSREKTTMPTLTPASPTRLKCLAEEPEARRERATLRTNPSVGPLPAEGGEHRL